MKIDYLTITIQDKCFDLPKDMPIPQKGDTVFIEGKVGMVDYIHYHIHNGQLHTISIFTINY